MNSTVHIINSNEDISESDNNTKLKILNYTGDKKSDFVQYRGYIIDNNNNLICPSFGHTEELLIDSNFEIPNPEQWKWFYSIEGTLLRLFYYDEQWYLTTHKKLSAFRSRWSCKYSFGDIFLKYIDENYEKELKEFFEKEAVNLNKNDTESESDNDSDNTLEHEGRNRVESFDLYKRQFDWFTSNLDKDTCYYFLLRCNSQNRIICNINHLKKNEKCIFVAYRKDNEFHLMSKNEELNDEKFKIFSKFDRIEQLRNLETVESIREMVNSIDPFMYQGIVGFNFQNEKVKVLKILNKSYKEWITIRGNNPNIRLRYLELRKTPDMLEKLFNLYPNQSEAFDKIEENMLILSRKIHRCYVDRYIKNKYVTLPKDEYLVMKKCHDMYLEDRKIKIFSKNVLSILNDLSPYTLYNMLRRVESEKRGNFGKNIL